MKKKNILMIALSLCLIAVIAVSGTLAYFTDTTDASTNTFTMGKVNIKLWDQTGIAPGKGEKVGVERADRTGIDYTGVMPGDTLDKDVKVSISYDSAPSYMGILVTFDGDDPVPDVTELEAMLKAALVANGVKDKWTYNPVTVDGKAGVLYVYNEIVKPDGKAATELPFITNIHIPEAWNNAYTSKTFNIKVKAYAVQADNFADTFEEGKAKFVQMVEGNLKDSSGNPIEFEQVD